jgi:replicative DNA helicase
MAKPQNIDQGLPSSPEAERMVLGAILVDSDKMSEATTLDPEDFSLENHKRVFKRMRGMWRNQEHIDRITVANELLSYGELDACGGLSYLVSLDDGIPQMPNITAYLKIVKEKAILRRIIFASQQLQQRALLQEESAESILQGTSQVIAALDAALGVHKSFLTPRDIIDEYGGLQDFITQGVTPGIPTGFPQLDELLNGLQEGSQIVISGNTGSGKSALSENIAVNLAKNGIPVVIFSLEMGRSQLLARAMCSEAEVPLKAYLKNSLDSEQRARLFHAASELADLPVYFEEADNMNILDLAARVNRAVVEKKARVVMVDYLQLLEWRGERTTFADEFAAEAYASRTLKLIAKHHKITTIPLSQITMDKKREGERPKLSDIRGRKSVGFDADAVVAIWRAEQFKPGDKSLYGLAEAIMLKNRMGELGTAHLKFRGAWTKFTDEGKPEHYYEGSDD